MQGTPPPTLVAREYGLSIVAGFRHIGVCCCREKSQPRTKLARALRRVQKEASDLATCCGRVVSDDKSLNGQKTMDLLIARKILP